MKDNNGISKIRLLFVNFSYSLISNLISLVVSTITVLLLPKFLGATEYGYWQLYVLYVSYTGFLQLGWCDGVYLRYGGKEYNDLNKNLIASQFWYISIFYIISVGALFFLLFIIREHFNLTLVIFSLISGFITTPRGILYYILQATNNIQKFAKAVILDRVIFALIVLMLLLIGYRDFFVIIYADIIGKLVALFAVIYFCRDIVWVKLSQFKQSIFEAWNNLNAGYKLMFANIAGQLIVGTFRFNIEAKWGIEIFGGVSLTLSISSLLMLFINAVAIIMFPILRKISQEHLASLYVNLRIILMCPILFFLVAFYPLSYLVKLWLPSYTDSLKYMALLFPIVVYESKMSLLINTYLKTMRKERQMLLINLFIVFLSLIVSYVTVYVFSEISLAIIAIVFLLMTRCIVAEFYICKILKVNVIKSVIEEVLLSIAFIITAWFFGNTYGIWLYLMIYVLYLIVNKKNITISILDFKNRVQFSKNK